LFTDGDFTYVMLYPRGKVDSESSINYKMIKKGYAKYDEETFNIPDHV